jgi:alkylation response protein AidB-like acyl-CoA dehydrogenase
MNDVLLEDDLLAWQDAIDRYVRQALAPLCAQSEHPMAQAEVRRVAGDLADLGVLNLSGDPAMGLWDDPRDPLQRRLALHVLQALASYAPGVAYLVHGLALSARLERSAGVLPDGMSTVSLQGWLGLGRDAVVPLAQSRTPSVQQQALLADNWAWPTRAQPRLVHALPDWQAMWMPIWLADTGWQWWRVPRAACLVQPCPNSHGLDELLTQQVWMADVAPSTLAGSSRWKTLQGSDAQQAWLSLQTLHTMGLLAMSQAVARQAGARAQEQAHLRRQGGQTIVRHVAVQQLLSQCHSAVQESDQVLRHWASAQANGSDLLSCWRDRARCQVRLSEGTSAALQVFGGMGYMRDNAMEKALRDVNHLRLLGGSPAELRLCVAHADACLEEAA